MSKQESTHFSPSSKIRKLLERTDAFVQVYNDGILIAESRKFDDVDRTYTVFHGVLCDTNMRGRIISPIRPDEQAPTGCVYLEARRLMDGLDAIHVKPRHHLAENGENGEFMGHEIRYWTPSNAAHRFFMFEGEGMPFMGYVYGNTDGTRSIFDNQIDVAYNNRGKKLSPSEADEAKQAHQASKETTPSNGMSHNNQSTDESAQAC